MELIGAILFIAGCFTGGVMIWVLRQSEINTVKKGQDQLTEAFNNLSNKALLENQSKFMELAEDKFSAVLGKTDEKFGKKKEVIERIYQ